MSSFTVYLLGNFRRENWIPVFPGDFTIVKGEGGEPRPIVAAAGDAILVISDVPFDPVHHHPTWATECFLVYQPTAIDSGVPINDRAGARSRLLPTLDKGVAIMQEKIEEYLTEFASGVELRDALRNLKRITDEENKVKTVDDITAMTLHEKVCVDYALRTIRVDGLHASSSSSSSVPASILGLTPVPHGTTPDLVVSVTSAVPADPLDDGDQLTVHLVQPAPGTSEGDLVALWMQLKAHPDPSIMYFPAGMPVDDPLVQRLVALSLLRKKRHPASSAGILTTLQTIERSSQELKVNAMGLKL